MRGRSDMTEPAGSQVDGKDEARQAEVRIGLAEAYRSLERTILKQTKWLAGILLGGLAIAVSIILSWPS